MVWSIGLDVGTSGCKVLAVSEDGNVLGSAKREYRNLFPQNGWIEVNPEDVWNAVVLGLQEVLNKVGEHHGRSEKPASLALSVSGDEVVPLCGDRPLYNVIMSGDVRGREELDILLSTVNRMELQQATGLPPAAKFGINRMVWFRRNLPHVYAEATRFATWEDFIIGRMTGRYVCSYSSAARLMCFDINAGRWYEPVLQAAGIGPGMLPEVAKPGTVVGFIDGRRCPELENLDSVAVVAGGFDQACAALGSGVVEDEVMGIGTGTVETASFYSSRRLPTNDYPANPSLTGSGFVYTVTNPSGGAILRWFRDNFTGWTYSGSEPADHVYERILGEMPDEVSGLLVLPHFSGAGAPFHDPRSSGTILGLRLSTTRSALVKGLLEGLCYELKFISERFRETSGIQIRRAHASGGGAKSDRWLQIKADILGLPVYSLKVLDASALGAAIMALTGVRVFCNPVEAVGVLVQKDRCFVPRQDTSRLYQSYYAIYSKLYAIVSEISHELFDVYQGVS